MDELEHLYQLTLLDFWKNDHQSSAGICAPGGFQVKIVGTSSHFGWEVIRPDGKEWKSTGLFASQKAAKGDMLKSVEKKRSDLAYEQIVRENKSTHS